MVTMRPSSAGGNTFISGAFSASGRVLGARALIVDDVRTTGATLLEAERALRSAGVQEVFSLTLVQGLRRTYRLKSRFARLQEQGLLTARQIEDMLGLGTNRAKYWRQAGVLKVVKLNQHYKDLYQRPTEAELETMRHRHRNPSTPKTQTPK